MATIREAFHKLEHGDKRKAGGRKRGVTDARKEVEKLLVVVEHAKVVTDLHHEVAVGEDAVSNALSLVRNGGITKQSCLHTHGAFLLNA